MLNQKLKRDCGRARNSQGSPKAGARAIFVQKNLAQSPYMYMPLGSNVTLFVGLPGKPRIIGSNKNCCSQDFGEYINQDDK